MGPEGGPLPAWIEHIDPILGWVIAIAVVVLFALNEYQTRRK
jgi:hypothetical protein